MRLADELGHQRFRVAAGGRRLESADARSHHEILLPRALGAGVRFRLEVGPCHRLGQIFADVHALDARERRVLNKFTYDLVYKLISHVSIPKYQCHILGYQTLS